MNDQQSIDQYFLTHGAFHTRKVVELLSPLHIPDEHPVPAFEYVPEGRKPFEAQAHVVAAAMKMFDETRNGMIIGEMGVGKSLIGALAVHEHAMRSRRQGGYNGRYRALVLCPDHLVRKWKDELESTIPGVRVHLFDVEGKGLRHLLPELLALRDAMRERPGKWRQPEGPEWFVLGRNQAKFFPGRENVGHFASRKRVTRVKSIRKGKEVEEDQVSRTYHCPTCGKPVTDKNGNPIDVSKADKLLACEGLFAREVPAEGRKEAGLDRTGYLVGTFAKAKPGTTYDHRGKKYKVYACGEKLWQFTPRPRRWPPGSFLSNQMHKAFTYMIIDEVQEQKSATAARALACGKLMASARHCLALTGTLIGGYAKDLYPLLMRMQAWSIREEGFEWGKSLPFTREYGRLERIETVRTAADGRTTVSTGTMSMKKDTKKDDYQPAPGIMPSLFGRHLIDKAIFLSLDDVAVDLPKITEYVGGDLDGEMDAEDESFYEDCKVEMAKDQHDEYKRVERVLVSTCREMLQTGSMKLLGAMMHTLLRYPDHPWGWVPPPELRGQYDPASPPMAVGYWDLPGSKGIKNWRGVVQPASLDQKCIYPKEKALLDICRREVAAGNQVWVYVQMSKKMDVQPRLKQLLEEIGLRVSIMRQTTVEPRKRLDWIDREGTKADVIISHPQLVETGIDFFSKKPGGHNYNAIVFYQTGYSLFTMRQAARRAWRIGQKKSCRVYYLHYASTMQFQAMVLMARKMAAAKELDGDLNVEGLTAMADNQSAAMALARSISNAIDDEDVRRSWVKLGAKKKPPVRSPLLDLGFLSLEDAPIDGLDLLPLDAQLVASALLVHEDEGQPQFSREDLARMFDDLFGMDDAAIAELCNS